MTTRYQNKIIMPTGPLTGPTGLMLLSPEERANEFRWHNKEWHQFLAELKVYRRKIANASYDATMRLWEQAQKCPKCAARRRAIRQAMRPFVGPRRQRGSIILDHRTAGVPQTDCTFTASTIPSLNEFNVEPTDSYTRARLHSDGDWYYEERTTSGWGATHGTWQGGCAIADYDTRWERLSGTVPNDVVSGSDGVWSAATTSKAVGYVVTGIGINNGSFELECRDGTSLNVLFVDAFSMTCEVDARN